MNRLSESKSPYLRQHSHNPVDWYPWGEEALEKARSEDKWIFLSIGYSSCHWCHVMERESFEDPAIASYLNEHFVSIKVDREERPDVDAIYMEAVQIISGHGGWPLSVWLNTDLVPVFGGTYFPPADMHQRPGFLTVMRRLMEIRHQDPTMVGERLEKIRLALNHDVYESMPAAALTVDTIDKAIKDYTNRYDVEFGGFSSAPKFPQAMGLRFLLGTDQSQAHQMALNTLTHIIQGGIWDALGGGLHRYSTDHTWLVPHFEKMLYDQATILDALSFAQSKYPNQLFASAIDDMIAFLERDMKHPKGGYFCALDADTGGVEGLTYLWTDEQLSEVLDSTEVDIARIFYGIQQGGNWEGNHILVRHTPIKEVAYRTGVDEIRLEPLLATIRQKLYSARQTRPQPAVDHKVLTSWNALLLSALIDTGLRTNHFEALEMAQSLGEFLAEAINDRGTYRVCYDGKWEQQGFLDDVAFLALACFKMVGVRADSIWLDRGIHLVETIRNRYFDRSNDAFWYSDISHDQPVSRTREIFDNAMPSATSGAIAAFMAAYQLTGDRNYEMIAQSTLQKLSTVMADHGTAFGTVLQLANAVVEGRYELVLVGAEPEPFIHVWREFDKGNITLVVDRDGRGKGPLFEGRAFDASKTTAWLCKDGACELPVYQADDLRGLLKK
jgi:uncharacterized protein